VTDVSLHQAARPTHELNNTWCCSTATHMPLVECAALQDPSCIGGEAEPATSFEALEGLPLQLVALKLSNPGPLLASCTAAHRSVSAVQGFQVEWFCRWAAVLVPYRPWQYAAVTWQRLGGPKATAEQLCSFVLDCIATKRQEMQQAKQLLVLLRRLQALSVEPEVPEVQDAAPAGPQQTPADSQQQPGQQHTPTETKQPGKQRQEFTLMPYCLPLPSLIKQARQHLAQGRALKALLLLCPGNPLLLHPYASMAGNLSLLVQLVQQQSVEGPYPEAWITLSCDVERVISTAQLCCFGGHAHVLSWVLKTAGHTLRDEAWRVKQLLKHAIRRSNRACVVELLEFLPCSSGGLQRLQPWHQHVAMAAARTDPWAADVLQLLLQAVGPKQRAAKYMGKAYYAACCTGHVPVLQQLLDQAATAPQQHMHVLLLAAAEAGNEKVWRQLLQPGGGSSSSSTTNSSCSTVGEGGRAPQAPQQQWAEPVLVVPALPWQDIGVDDCAEVLLRVLDGMRCCTDKGIFDPCQDSRQAAMADVLWQNECLGSSAGLWEEVRLAVTTQLALGSVRTEQHHGRYGRLLDLLAEPKLGRLLWLHSHGLLQWHEPPQLSSAAQEGLQAMVLDCVKRRDAAALSTMLQLSQRLKHPLPAAVFVSGAVAAAADSAVRAGNLAALQQLAAFEQFATLALPMLRSAQMTFSIAVQVSLSAPEWEHRSVVCLAALAAWAAAEFAKAKRIAQLGLSVPATAQVIFQALQDNVLDTEACQQALHAAVQEWQAGGCDWRAGRLEGTGSWFPGIQCSCGLPGGRPLEVAQSGATDTMGWLASYISTHYIDRLKSTAWHSSTQAQDMQRIMTLLEKLKAARTQQQQQQPSEPNSNSTSTSSRNDGGGGSSAAAGDAAAATPAAVHVPPGTDQQQPASILPLWQLAGLAVKVVGDSKATQGPRAGVASALLAGVHPIPVAAGTTAACGGCTVDCRAQGDLSGQAVAATATAPADASAATATAPAGASAATATAPAGASAATATAPAGGAGAAAAAAQATWPWGPTVRERAVVTAVLQAYGGIGAVASDLPEVLLHRLDVAAWLLQPSWKELWPMPREIVDSIGRQLALSIERVLNGHREDVINAAVDRHEAEQLRHHRQQLRQGVAYGFPPIPHFAVAAGNLMGVLLLQPAAGTWPGQLGDRVAELLAGNSSAVQVEKVKAMLAVLASVPKDVLDRSWHLVLPAGLRQVCGVGDTDLMALLLLYDKRGILASDRDLEVGP